MHFSYLYYITRIYKSQYFWYNDYAVTSLRYTAEGGGNIMLDILCTIGLAIVANVISYYVCKWLDNK